MSTIEYSKTGSISLGTNLIISKVVTNELVEQISRVSSSEET